MCAEWIAGWACRSSMSLSPPASAASTTRRSVEGDLDAALRKASRQRAEAPLELCALDGVGGELDRLLVGARGARGVARAAEQLGVRRVQRLVALERGIGEQRLEQLQAGGGPG